MLLKVDFRILQNANRGFPFCDRRIPGQKVVASYGGQEGKAVGKSALTVVRDVGSEVRR